MPLALLMLLFMSAIPAYSQDASQVSFGFNNNTPRPATPEEIAALNMTPEEMAVVNVSSAMVYPNGYIMMAINTDNVTPEQLEAMKPASSTMTEVSFWELPTWIQVSYLSGALIALAGSVALLPLVVRKVRDRLDNRNRDMVYRHIVDNPGCTAPDVSRGQSLNTGTVRYHIQRLELSGKIILKKIGKFTRLYKNASTFSENEMLIASHLRNETSRLLLYAVLENPGTTNQRLAEQFNIDKSTVYVHMQRLVNDDIVVSKMDGKQKRYFVSEQSKPVLEKFRQPNGQFYGMAGAAGLEKLVASRLNDKTSKAVIEALMEHPASTDQGTSELTKVEKSLIYRYIQQLVQDGIVSVEDDGGHKRYSIAEAAKPAIVKLLPRNYQCPGMMREYGKDEA